MKDFHLIKDFAVIAALFAALLYMLGYLNETAFLEKMGLNQLELMPDPSTAIMLGFRFSFIKSFVVFSWISILVPYLYIMSLGTFDSVNNFFIKLNIWFYSRWPRFFKKISIERILEKMRTFFLMCIFLIFAIACQNSMSSASKDVKDLMAQAEPLDTVVVNSGLLQNAVNNIDSNVKAYTGKVVRVRDGLVLFWLTNEGRSVLIPLKNVVEIAYGAHTVTPATEGTSKSDQASEPRTE